MKFFKESLKAVVDDNKHAGRQVKTSCRGLPMFALDDQWLQELKQ